MACGAAQPQVGMDTGAYAHPHFERGRAWVFRATERHVEIEGQLAWFDEALDTEGLGPARGSGVLRREDGVWKIVHYNLTITVPNERFREVKELLSADPESASADAAEDEDAAVDADAADADAAVDADAADAGM